MNVREVVADIRARVVRDSIDLTATRRDSDSTAIDEEVRLLRGAYARLYDMRGLVGQMPPSPSTFRARVGRHLIRIVQRMLFWYTPQIHRVQKEVTSAIGSLSRLIETQRDEIAALRKQVRVLSASQSASQAPSAVFPQPTQSGFSPSFEFSLQDHFRGSEQDATEKLNGWLTMIRDASRRASGEWLDVGSGRGEWLALASANGHSVTGIDANPVAVDYCISRGLNAVPGGAIEHLDRLPDESLDVITMFHVVEHIPADRLPALAGLAHRKLRPEGLLAIETPNPANLLMGSHYFWNDPTHLRPLPEELLSFILSYAGFTIVKRAGLNPFPPENHLPFTEINVVRQVDDLLYGTRDYGLLVRK